jgi:hypothetical protein
MLRGKFAKKQLAQTIRYCHDDPTLTNLNMFMQAKSIDQLASKTNRQNAEIRFVKPTVIRNTCCRDLRHTDTVIPNTIYRDLKHDLNAKHRDLKHFLMMQLSSFTDEFVYVICFLNVQINNNQSGCLLGWGRT